MMQMKEYEDRGPVKVPQTLDLGNMAGKSVIVTGGASGLGRAYTEAFAEAGSFVTVADIDEAAGLAVIEAHAGNSQFVKCDVRNWDDQVNVFETAIANSPHQSIDVVIANAGIIGQDDLYTLQDPQSLPTKPDLRIIEINLIGAVYTAKLAMHYFRRQSLSSNRDRCLILKASIAAYIDNPGSPQYNISKFGVRALMRNLRRTIWSENIRVNLVAPWFMRTPILSSEVQKFLDSQGVGFALVEDAVRCMLKIASDPGINGRGFGVFPHAVSREGYMDLNKDDYKDGDTFKTLQEIALATTRRLVE